VEETLTGDDGVFHFPNVAAGRFRVSMMAKGFMIGLASATVLPGQVSFEVPPVALIPSTETDVEVTFTKHDLAEEQMKAQEKQRVLGVFPNFYASYVWNAVPLTSKQKYRLALRTTADPVAFLGSGVTAGIEQWQNYYSGYGQGGTGYAKRFGASYADGFTSTLIGGAVLPSLLHQDPRYFYRGTGSIASRALYAVSRIVICKGDNGKWQPNYSNVLGNLAAAGISNAYYPSTDRDGAKDTIDGALIGTAGGAIGNLIQEFLLKRISRGIHSSAGQP